MTPPSTPPAAPTGGHVPVLAGPAIDGLQVQPKGIYVDCTAGPGGHSALVAERLEGGQGRLIALDRDPEAVARAASRLAPYPNAAVYHWNYAELAQLLEELGVERTDGVLFDLGVSSLQLDNAVRGFSFEKEGPLDMRMDPTTGQTARTFLHEVGERDLAHILKTYGDVRPAKRIAAAIVHRRGAGELETTKDLAEAVAEALDFVRGVPVETRTVFQAIRIAVNEELRWLETGLRQAVASLAPRGRLVCIAFHSGEDAVVKAVLRSVTRRQRELEPNGRVRCVVPPCMRLVTPKPVSPGAEEIRANPRAHSARLRIAERLFDTGDGP